MCTLQRTEYDSYLTAPSDPIVCWYLQGSVRAVCIFCSEWKLRRSNSSSQSLSSSQGKSAFGVCRFPSFARTQKGEMKRKRGKREILKAIHCNTIEVTISSRVFGWIRRLGERVLEHLRPDTNLLWPLSSPFGPPFCSQKDEQVHRFPYSNRRSLRWTFSPWSALSDPHLAPFR